MGDRLASTGAAVAVRSRLAGGAVVLAVIMGSMLASGSAAGAAGTARATSPARASAVGGTGGSIDAIACTSAGNCTAVGSRTPASAEALFVVAETNGTWGKARTLPGVAALLRAGVSEAHFAALSCSSTGNCGAGGFYVPSTRGTKAFVVSERNGVWGSLEQVPGLAALNAEVSMTQAMSCSSDGNCSADGFYEDSHGNDGAFVVSEKNGTWGKASNVRGLSNPGLNKITCVSPGNCVGIGEYGTFPTSFPFMVTQRNGIWGKPRNFPRINALSTHQQAAITSISCHTRRDCTAAGFYYTTGQHDTVFAFREQKGVWGPVIPIPGMETLAPPISTSDITINSLSCPSQGNCTVGGDFANIDNSQQMQPYLVTQRAGTWRDARLIPGVAKLSAQSQDAGFTAVACPSAGNCSAVGIYSAGDSFGGRVYVTTEKNGSWSTAAALPGFAAVGAIGVNPDLALSCAGAGSCSLGGSYANDENNRPYLATQSKGTWGSMQQVKGVRP